jgi:phage repressor protein C with HTH and peptisase S24 domain
MPGSKAFDPEIRRRALRAFMKKRPGLNPNAWAKACHPALAESTIRNFINGDSDSLSDRTYQLLAAAAHVPVSELRGEKPVQPARVDIPIEVYVGAGDEIYPLDGPLDYTPAPPGYESGGAAIVRGESMRPMYDEGDILYYAQRETPPKGPTRRAVIVQVKDGPLFVKKLLPGTKRGRFHLLSLNPLTAPMLDRPVESIARIGWVKPVE